MDYKTETRSFNGGGAMDGYAGFRVGRTYPLRYEILENGDVAIEMDHIKRDEGQTPLPPTVMSFAQFKQWFVK